MKVVLFTVLLLSLVAIHSTQPLTYEEDEALEYERAIDSSSEGNAQKNV